MVVYNYFPNDPRVRREADALIRVGYSVDVICVRDADNVKEESVYGVNVFRLNISKSRESKKKYIIEYFKFFFSAFFKLNGLFIKNRYDAIHIHNMPDFLVFIAIIPKMMGKTIFLDLHDPSPEMLMTKFTDAKDGFLTKLLKWQERISIKFSNSVITTNKSFLDKFISRGCPKEKIQIVMNSPQESIFDQFSNNSKENSDDKKFILMFHGVIVERHGLDVLARSVDILKEKIPGLEVIAYGRGEYVSTFLKLVEKLQLESVIKFCGRVSLEEIAKIITNINLGVIPNKLTPFTQINFPTRIFEYLCMKKPVVVPRTQGIKDYFDEDSIFYFDAGNEKDLADVIFNVYSNPDMATEVVTKGYEVYQKHRWEKQSGTLVQMYEKNMYGQAAG